MVMKKLELLEKLESISYGYDIDEYYTKILNTLIDYENECQEWDYSDRFQDIIDYDYAEELAKQELENGGLLRLHYFLVSADLTRDLFIINGYGNLETCEKEDVDCILNEILEELRTDLSIESEVE